MIRYKADRISCGDRTHAEGYQTADNIDIAACADLIEGYPRVLRSGLCRRQQL